MINFFSLLLAALFLISPIKVLATTTSNEELNWYYSFDKNLNTLLSPREAPFLSDEIAIFKGDESQKVLYLTFDEGYENGFTPSIIDTLNKNNVSAAFFVTKPYITSQPELIKKMYDGNHLVCNHTTKHKSMPTLVGTENFTKEFKEVEVEYTKITGDKMPIFFRPPMGKYSHKSLLETKKLGYISVFWSFAYKDWLVDEQPSPNVAFNKITSNIHNGQIMLLHACSKTNAMILDKLIKHLKSEGYEFRSLNDFNK